MVHLLIQNLGADAGVGKYFQQRVRHSTVHNGHAVDSAVNGIQRTINFGQHAFTDGSVRNERLDFGFFQRRNGFLLRV